MPKEPGGARRPTIYDVARRAGVSHSLVSLVLQGSPKVSPPRLQAVLAAIAELGYRPSRAATDLASHRTKSVEVLIDDYRNLSFVGLVRGLHSELSPQGYHLTVTDRQFDRQLPGDRPNRLASNVDAMVIAAEPDAAHLLAWAGPTVVAGWRENVPAGADMVANDDELGGRLAVDHLVRLGHRNVGHLTGAGGPAAHRRHGFDAGMAAADLPSRQAGDHRGTSEEDGYVAAAELLDRFPGTTAIFAANDTMALGALAALRDRGLVVPDDVSILGYDNSPLAQSRFLNLTSIDDRSEDVGGAVGRALLARIDDPTTAPVRLLIEPTLVIRGTTASPPGAA